MSLFIGIDSGTQSVKAVALDLEEGRVVAQGRAPHAMIAGLPPGHMEQHPEDWAVAMEQALLEVATQVDASRVRGIGVSGQQHGFVPLDGHGKVIRPAKLWCDTSTAAECALLTRRMGGRDAVLAETGLPFLPGYTAPKILWMKRHEAALFRRLRHILLPHDYLNAHLTGVFAMEAGDASGTGLLDVRRRAWSAAAMAAVDARVEGCLPALVPAPALIGGLRPGLARALGLPEGTPVSAGGGDNMMGAIGTGAVSPGVVSASLGTSGTIYAQSAAPVVDPAGEIAAFCSSTGQWLPLVCTMNVTRVTEQVRGLFGWDHDQFERAAAGVPAGSDGLVLLPFLDGERTPSLPGATGVLSGLTRATFSPGHMARAAMEGATLGLNYGFSRLRALGVRPAQVRLTGGGARSALWRRMMADVLGVPVVAMAEDEGAALGAALQAAWAAGGTPTLAALAALCGRIVKPDESTRCEPDAGRRGVYRAAQKAHDALRDTLAPGWAG